MIARRLPQLRRHRFATVLVAVPLGAFLALIAVKGLAVFAGLLGMTALHDILRDVGVNTGPFAFFGGIGAGLGAWAGGGPPPKRGDRHSRTDTYDPVTKKWTYRWETPSERFSDAMVNAIQNVATAIVGPAGEGSSGNAAGKENTFDYREPMPVGPDGKTLPYKGHPAGPDGSALP